MTLDEIERKLTTFRTPFRAGAVRAAVGQKQDGPSWLAWPDETAPAPLAALVCDDL